MSSTRATRSTSPSSRSTRSAAGSACASRVTPTSKASPPRSSPESAPEIRDHRAAAAMAGAVVATGAGASGTAEVAVASATAAGAAEPHRMADTAQVTELDSGIRVVTENIASVRSVALGLWVRTGSRDETPAQAGVSHFLEHLLFKGTKRYSAIEIAEIFDGLGASVNAATGKESTNLYARFLDTHTDEAFELLAEMLLGPTYPEIDSEREVVLEEIAMYEDEPQDKVHDVLDRAVFGGHPLGRRVLGEAEVISSIPVPEIDAYHRARYTGANIVVAAAGNIDHEGIVELTRRHVEPPVPAGEASHEPPQADGAQVAFQQKDTEQFHICFGGLGIDRADERRYALTVLDAVFGGST